MRPIDADALKRYICKKCEERFICEYYDFGCSSMAYIDDQPTLDVEPVKHSHWFYPFSELDINRCWECGMHVQDKINNVRETFKYCPNCGARMDGD